MINSVEFKNAVETVLPTNHIFVADVSYSMYNALPKIREHLKQNLARLVKPEDTVSILYFSSRGEYGPVFVGEKVNSIQDLSNVHQAIDRFLKPIGCTGFVEPLKLAIDTAEQLASNGNLASLIFMTDGYDNCWSESDILKVCSQLSFTFNNITFLEYGWHCNRPLLEKMSDTSNALHTFVEDYSEYEPAFEQSLQQITSKRIEISAPDADHVVYLDNGQIHIVNVSNSVALIPEHVSHVWLLNSVDEVPPVDTPHQDLYVALYYAIHRMNPDMAWNILRVLGDVRLVKMYQSCFTKQDYSNIKSVILDCINDPDARFAEGQDFNLVPDDNASTVLDVIQVLLENDAVIDISSPDFVYNRTGRRSVQKDDTTISDLSAMIASAESEQERKALAAKMLQHETWKPEFVATDKTASVNNIVFNSSRPNISINTVLHGIIPVPSNVRDAYALPEHLQSKIYRNYTLVRDGILNVKNLPMYIDESAIATFDLMGVKYKHMHTTPKGRAYIDLDLSSVPLVNRAMTKNLSGQEFALNHVKLLEMKAHQKVLKHIRDDLVGAVNVRGLAEMYGDSAAAYLSSVGIRDYGFSPKSTKVESTDVYMSKELVVSIRGASSIPSISAVEKKIAGGKKLNAVDKMIRDALEKYTAELSVMSVNDQMAYIDAEAKRVIHDVRALEKSLSKTMYGIVVAHRWFDDVDFDEPTLIVSYSGNDFTVTMNLEENAIKI